MAELEYAHADEVYSSGADLRHGWDGLQAGVLGAGDFKVTAGAGLSVDVAAGVCFVLGSATPDQGLYRCRTDEAINSDDFELGGIPPNGSTNPRLDQVVARAYDAAHDGGTLRKWRLEYLEGTATSGATLDNRTGHANLQPSTLLLADVLTPGSNPATIPGANIRDRRPWARGAFARIARSANAAAGNDYSTTSGSFTDVDSTNLSPRVECSGAPLRLTFSGQCSYDTGRQGLLAITMDGGTYPSNGGAARAVVTPTGSQTAFHIEQSVIVSAGSHRFTPRFATDAIDGTPFNLLARVGPPIVSLIFTVEEILRSSAAN